MTATATQTDFAKNLVPTFTKAYEQGQIEGAQMLWVALLTYLENHLKIVIIVLALVLIMAFVEYFLTQRWRMLGSVLWHYSYFGIVFIIGLIWGPVVFVSDYLSLATTLILYPLCYFGVRWILTKLGIRK